MLITRFIIETVTPMHCGGNEDLFLDQIVTRDAFGLYRIPGTAIAGVLRSYLSSTEDEATVNELFGSRDSEDLSASKIWCSDAVLLDYDDVPCYEKILSGKSDSITLPSGPFVRDHVKLDLDTAVTVQGGKFDEEIVPPGARFAFELKFDAWDKEGLNNTELENAFNQLCADIAAKRLRFGGKKVSGYGAFKTVYAECSDFELTNEKGLADYLNLKSSAKFSGSDGVKVALNDAKTAVRENSESFNFDLTIPLKTDGPILVGGPNSIDSEVDMPCLITPCLKYGSSTVAAEWMYTIPGSSFRGAVRHRVYEIASVLNLDAKTIVDDLFGKVGENAKSGKLIFDDCYIPMNGSSHRVQHVAIDAFTGGALDGALFDEKPVWMKDLELSVHIRGEQLKDKEPRLLLHALLDLCTGELPIGGGVNRGNGKLFLRDFKEQGIAHALKNIEFSGQSNGEPIDLNDPDTLEMIDGDML